MLGKGEGGGGEGGRREASLSLCLQITAVPRPLMYPDIMSTLPFNVCTYSTVPTPPCIFLLPKFFHLCSATVIVPSKYIWSLLYYSL
jgi:hypothetical protein